MRVLQRFLADSSGALSMLFVVLFPLLMLVGGVATDVTMLNAQKRYVQSQADLAAMSAANHLPNVAQTRAVARQIVAANQKYGTIALTDADIRIGRYDAATGAFIPAPNQRVPQFASAVEVVVPSSFRPFLLQPVLSDDNITLRRAAVGVQRSVISFTLRNRLLSLNTDNAVLGRLLGPLGLGLNLEALGYRGLASTKVSLNNLLGLIAETDLGLDALSFDDVLNLRLRETELLAHLVRLGGLASIDIRPTAPNNRHLTLGQIVGASPGLLGLTVGNVLPDIELNVFDLIGAMIGLARQHQPRVTVDLPVNLGSLADIDVGLDVIAPPVIAVGFVNDVPPPTAELAQIGATVSADVLGTDRLALLRADLYAGVGTARAFPTSLNCGASGNQVLATFSAQTSPVELALWVRILDTRTTNAPRALSPVMLGGGTTSVSVTHNQFLAQTPVAVANALNVSGIATNLASLLRTTRDDLVQEVNQCSGLFAVLTCPFKALLNLTLAAVLSVVSAVAAGLGSLLAGLGVNQLVNGLLNLLGIGTAQADLILNSYSCSPALVR